VSHPNPAPRCGSASWAAGAWPTPTAAGSRASAQASRSPTRAGRRTRRKRSPRSTAACTRSRATRSDRQPRDRRRGRRHASASHLEWTMAALEAGKDVILEKPPVLRSADLGEIQRVCAERGRLVFVAENYYYKPVLAAVREAMASGAIGEPLFLHLNAVKRQRTADWRDDPAEAGGGALFEGGIHWVNFAARSASRSRRSRRPGRGGGKASSGAWPSSSSTRKGPSACSRTPGRWPRSSAACAPRDLRPRREPGVRVERALHGHVWPALARPVPGAGRHAGLQWDVR